MKKIKNLTQWLMAFVTALLIVNALCFFYERPAYFISTPDGASPVIRQPGALNTHGTEGYSMGRVDQNGYLNPEKPLSDNFVLVMGASHTLGKELPLKERFSVLVSKELSQGDGMLHTYNIAHDGNFLPSIFRHFGNAVQLYPYSSAIVIEIGNTDFTPQEIQENLKEIPDCSFQTAQERFQNISQAKKIKQMIKGAIPFLELMQVKARTRENANAEPGEFLYDAQQYEKAIGMGLSMMRKHYTGPIVFMYHPSVQVLQDGSIRMNYSKTWNLFRKACADYGIDVLDLGEAFCANYQEHHSLPYGFSNTTPGKGHMNRVGHQIAADQITAYLEEAAK